MRLPLTVVMELPLGLGGSGIVRPEADGLGPDAVRRFGGAVGRVVARGTGPVILDVTGLRGWSADGQPAIADGSVVPPGDCPDIPVHRDLAAAFAAHARREPAPEDGHQGWRTDGWPT